MHLTAACAALLLASLFLGSPTQLRAQCGADVHNLCDDSCCFTDAVLLNTGYDHIHRGLYDIGAVDDYWHIIDAPVPNEGLPAASGIPDPDASWGDAFPNSRWIDANIPNIDPNPANVTYEKCFCVCGLASNLSFTLNINAGGDVLLSLDGELIKEYTYTGSPIKATFTKVLGPGRHCIEVEVRNTQYRYAALNVEGSITGPGLLKTTCCSGPPAGLNECQTDHLVLGTDATWTIASGPAGAGSFPRCATNITSPIWVWAPAMPGTSWIGLDAAGHSGPFHPGYDEYIYRKSFCVDQSGTFIITITSMADDAGEVFLNGVDIGPTGGYAGPPTTYTLIVALTEGCNCVEFRVRDLGFAVTGLDALVDIQGGILKKPDCCECGLCGGGGPPNGRAGRRDADGNDRMAGAANAGANTPAARPMLVSIPNPVTGESVVHYVLDKDATAKVELFNAAGQRVLVLDEGARKSGEHAVNLATKGLPAGAYRLLLIYGERRLSVPLDVR